MLRQTAFIRLILSNPDTFIRILTDCPRINFDGLQPMNVASIYKQLCVLTRVRGLCLLLVSALFSPILVASPITSERIVNADSEPGSWLAHGRTYSEQRFSPLSQINTTNVASMGLAWSFRTETRRGIEATPLVVDGVMYTTGSWSRVYALNAKTGQLIWKFDPEVPGSAGRKPCCDVVNRGVAMWGEKVFVGTIDGRLIALNAKDGSVAWQVVTVDQSKSYSITGAPRVVKGMVIIGNGGAELGVRGYFTAYDVDSGKQLWRFYTVPKGPKGPFEHPELAIAAETWSKDSLWETGLGGTVWDSMAYDPHLNLLYVGVGNSTPYDREVRSPGGGDNLFLTCILAINPDNGALAWYYQTTPAESWDYTATQHIILADLMIENELRQVLMQAPKNGFFYMLDRATGELLTAENYVPVTWATGIDMKTGRPMETGADWHQSPKTLRPGPGGGHNWQPMSYSPQTGLVYIPVDLNQYTFVAEKDFKFQPGWWNTGEDFPALVKMLSELPPMVIDPPTQLVAWDPIRQKEIWRVEHSAFKSAGILSTRGGLVFQGTGGQFVAYAADKGTKLWASEVGVGIMAPPISYSIDGEQYVAVMAGLGGGSLAMTPVTIENDGRLLVYKLAGKAAMPEFTKVTYPVPELPDIKADEQVLTEGGDLYSRYCLLCHGIAAASGGVLPDLRYSTKEVHNQWQPIVIGGMFANKGMASFADLLVPEEVDKIHAYVVHEARKIESN